ncbi:MAG TPA: NAD-dependent epimerase/dehydratase family protein [Candidatus Thermoplasmatota archaeon]
MPSLRGERCAVTGAAGFIGPHLLRALARSGATARGFDINRRAVAALRAGLPRGATLEVADAARGRKVSDALRGTSVLFHLAADPDVRSSTARPLGHFEANAVGTLRVADAARRADVGRIVFPSTSTVYGDATVVPTPETYAPLRPISVYGASKLAGENILAAYAATYGIDCVALRLANVVGPGATHGVIVDLVEKLKRDPRRLEVLGDGTQRKSYVHVEDMVAATLLAARKAPAGFQVYNVGSKDAVVVDEVARAVVEAMGLEGVELVHRPVAGGRGWAGDVKVMHLAIERIRKLGFTPRYASRRAVRETARAVARERAAGAKV